jgi:hypothetical protein
MKVFGIGLSRTGTKSLNAALRLLGFDIHHYPTDPITAREVITGSPYSILDRCDGLTDLHAAVRFRQLDASHPGSKFILTTREKERWLASCRRHFEHYRPETKPPFLRSMIVRLRREIYGVAAFDAIAFSAAYDRHVESVMTHFAGRSGLLVIDIPRGDGWDLLCPFLEKPDPGDSFPCIR